MDSLEVLFLAGCAVAFLSGWVARAVCGAAYLRKQKRIYRAYQQGKMHCSTKPPKEPR